jgi:A/G-specific adenine glycosylase
MLSVLGAPAEFSTNRRKKKEFAEKLLKWWRTNKRDFPWRRTDDPYKILIAELLLRKTTAKQVRGLYEGFLSKYPDSKALSKAQERDIEDTIRPLGLERKRATLLKAIGSEIIQNHGGQVPTSKDDLLKLSGVGSYAANAVLCFAYHKDVPLVDTNAIRIFQRVFGFKSQKRRPKDDPTLWDFVGGAIPHGKARDFNLAVIDHAHSICIPRNPRCPTCPLNALCKYAKERYRRFES